MRRHSITMKFGVFVTVTTILTVCLFAVFGQYRTGSAHAYSAIFNNVSRLKPGDSVRIAGLRVGTVTGAALRDDNSVEVRFDADSDVALTAGTRAAVRYLNLVGDRYMELSDTPNSLQILPPGSQIPAQRTSPALDLDLLLGGLKPVIRGLNPQDVNTLTASLIQVFQGQGTTLESLMAKTSSFSNTLADNGALVQQLIDNLKTVLGQLSDEGSQFSDALNRLQQLTTQLSADRDPIGDAIVALDTGTASLTDLLASARPPLAGTIGQLNRLAPLLDHDKGRIDGQIQLLPEDYRKMSRLGSYGSFLPVYLCGLSFRVSDLQGRTAVFPWIKQETGRCAEP